MTSLPQYDKDKEMAARLEPELVEFLNAVRNYVKDEVGDNPTVSSLRNASSAARIKWSNEAAALPELEITNLQINETGMAARLYLAPGSNLAPLLIYLHGGGWMMLGLDTHDRLMRAYAIASGYNVLALDYPLTPEMKFPDNLNACADAVEQIITNQQEYGNSSNKIVLGGDSSGANLALSIMAQLDGKAQGSICGLLLNYGVFDSNLKRNSYEKFTGSPYLLNRERMEFFWQNYCTRFEQRNDPRASPLCFDISELGKLPPVYMCIAAQDVLVDENILFEQKLLEAGVNVSSNLYENAAHGFLEAVNHSPLADDAISETAKWLKDLSG